jgi:uncharacterized protein
MQNPFSSPANQNQRPLSGKLAENIMHFARVLRKAGLPVGPGAVLDALDAACPARSARAMISTGRSTPSS